MSDKTPEPLDMNWPLLALKQDGAWEGMPTVLRNVFTNLVMALWPIREGGLVLAPLDTLCAGKDKQGQQKTVAELGTRVNLSRQRQPWLVCLEQSVPLNVRIFNYVILINQLNPHSGFVCLFRYWDKKINILSTERLWNFIFAGCQTIKTAQHVLCDKTENFELIFLHSKCKFKVFFKYFSLKVRYFIFKTMKNCFSWSHVVHNDVWWFLKTRDLKWMFK